jgi:hypothetical protein
VPFTEKKMSFSVNVYNKESVSVEFRKIVALVNKEYQKEAILYRTSVDNISKKLTKIQDNVLTVLKEKKLNVIPASSFSAGVNLIGDSDIDIVVLVSGHRDSIEAAKGTYNATSIVESLGFKYVETRNAEWPNMIHYVYNKFIEGVEVEVKIRNSDDFNGFIKIHNFLDNTVTQDEKIYWTYARKLVANTYMKDTLKYLWYMYGAVNTGVDESREVFPLNIFY